MRRRDEPLTVETALVAIVCAIAVVGLSLGVVTTSGATAMLVSRVGSAGLTGLGEERTLAVAEDVRAFVTGPGAPALPSMVGRRSAFDVAATAHLRDVRAALLGARAVTGAAAVVLAAWLARALSRRRWGRVHSVLRVGAGLTAGTVAAALLLGAADFEWLFTAFHRLFFAAGTWTFPADSLLVELFPERFWMVAGGAWGISALTVATLMWLAAGLLPGDRG